MNVNIWHIVAVLLHLLHHHHRHYVIYLHLHLGHVRHGCFVRRHLKPVCPLPSPR
jgi:hypothetical protein